MRRAILIVCCAAALAADKLPEPSEVMIRVLAKVRDRARKIPNYACVETVTREYHRALAPVLRSCDQVVALQDHRPLDMQLRHAMTDRLRLDVAMTKAGELHAWVGSASFTDSRIDTLVPEGPIGTGAFGGLLAAVFDQDVKKFDYTGDSVVNGRRRMQFHYTVAIADSHYNVKILDSWTPLAYSGSFEVDVETAELQWLEAQTAIMPPASGSCQTTTHLDFGKTALGEAEFLLTTQARQRFLRPDAGEVQSRIQFSDCREYRGESTIKFETDGPLETGGAVLRGVKGKQPAPPAAIPYGERFSLELLTPIESIAAAAGDRFTAKLRGPIQNRLGKVVIPAQARVEGRLLRAQTYLRPTAECVFVLRPETVEVAGTKIPLLARQDYGHAREQQRAVTGGKKGTLILLPFTWEKNAGILRLPGPVATLNRGFITYWITE